MNRDSFQLPFKIKFSIGQIIAEIEASDNNIGELKVILDYIKESLPELIDGVDTIEEFEYTLTDIAPIMERIMPKALMRNSLKALSFPLIDKFYFPSEDLRVIIEDQGTKIKSFFHDFTEENYYKLCCCFILSKYYNINIELDHTNLLEVDNGKGFFTYLTVMYSFEYLEIKPINSKFELSIDQIEDLLNNYENTDLWYQYFPVNSWIVKGIVLSTLFDNTSQIALSNLKTRLLTSRESTDQINTDVENSFKSIFKLSHLEIGFSSFNSDINAIVDFQLPIMTKSMVLNETKILYIGNIFCNNLTSVMNHTDYFVISNAKSYLQKNPTDVLAKNLLANGYNSIIMYPLRKNGEFLGILEIVSTKSGAFNRINANQIREILPLIEGSIFRYYSDFDHQVNSFIQTEFTSLHPSVEWKFKRRAKEVIMNPDTIQKKTQIQFQDVYPMYGEIDVRGSSFLRNQCMKIDYKNQINFLIKVCDELFSRTNEVKFLDYIEKLNGFLNRIEHVDKIYFEREIFEYISLKIHPEIPKYTKENDQSIIAEYLGKLDEITGLYYVERKKFDTSIFRLNELLSSKLDLYQNDAQAIFPHYYERFKTDGVDFNLYVGKSINPTKEFAYQDVKDIRFWQLQAMIAMEQQYYLLRTNLPIKIEVASLILATNMRLDIIFKMDEKRFDVDGYNNAKYEIIKKRINKAFIKDSEERINVPGKLCVIYTDDFLKDEYSIYIKELIKRGYLLDEIEYLEVGDLQGIGGLLAIRVPINYDNIIEKYDKF
ncbi:hypothetical protein [Faecalibacter macacae]|uniref:GAF domain-containing protein n=1 Tax=Faecalibacter macacae TaxID=1859289 RepID=A0A3L9M873_9FLAO|nr:hypothetical protein [Faecalibacter macacae]RLZ08743.1 hypothetical protein EAH69_09475 [Faecalibacter macacae]